MLRSIAIAAAAALMLVGCAATQTTAGGAGERDCFRAEDVNGYSVIDDHRISANINPQRQYILTIGQNTLDLDWTHALTIRSRTSFVCVGEPLGVELIGGQPPFPYAVTAIERAPFTAPTGS